MTGSARGIGRATAIRAAREGAPWWWRIFCPGRAGDRGRHHQPGQQAIFVLTDVRRTEDCDRMVIEAVKTFGRVDLVVNAAGVMDGYPPDNQFDLKQPRNLLFAPIHEATDEYWDQVLAVNTTGIFKSMRAELRQMLKQGQGGAIVNVGSIAGLTGLAGNPAYVASKHGVTGLTRNAAIDYAPYGIRVNSVEHGRDRHAHDRIRVRQSHRHHAGTGGGFEQPENSQHGSAEDPEPAHVLPIPSAGWRPRGNKPPSILFLLSDETANITGGRVGHRWRMDNLFSPPMTNRRQDRFPVILQR